METWGISGPSFLVLYAALVVAAAGAALLVQRSRGPRGAAGDHELGPAEAAYLSGGRVLAVTAALASLRADGRVDKAGSMLFTAGATPLGADAQPLERAAYRSLGAGTRSVSWIRKVVGGSEELKAIRATLEERGLLLRRAALMRTRAIIVLIFAPLLVLAAARMVAGVSNDRPIAFLIVASVLTVVVMAYFLEGDGARTPRGESVLAELRSRHRSLVSRRDRLAGAGPADLGLAIGLFGVGAIWSADAAFAAEMGLPREAAAGGGGGGFGGGGGGGGGCGGGGCGG